MGHGTFSSATYSSAAATRRAKGLDDFHYSRNVIQSGTYEIHDDLDPKGITVRESRDSVDHPYALPIAVFFDVTGSMSSYPRAIQKQLPLLLAHLENRVPDPQIMVGGIGDGTCDRVPLQVGQFESDNRIDDQLRSIVLEGGGGGGNHESYELAFYLLARHTAHDAMDKRNKKGHAFIVGDERGYPEVSSQQVASIIGSGFQGDLPMADIVAEAKKLYNLYFVAVDNHYRHENEQYWRGLVDHYLILDSPDELVSIIGDAVVEAEKKTVTTP